jgi:LuxR family maltose regulon positive regulatory protein
MEVAAMAMTERGHERGPSSAGAGGGKPFSVPAGPEGAPCHEVLSPRERQVVALVIEGFSDANVAARLSISEATVGSHLARIYRKLRVHTRVELVTRARAR